MKTLLFLLFFIPSHSLVSQELSGVISSEFRYFPANPLYNGQPESFSMSFSAQPKLVFKEISPAGSIVFQPFVRWDRYDSRRSHFDVRELYWHSRTSNWDISIGIQNIFWGVTESQHLIDIANQVDFVENLNRESKLGQPMIYLSTERRWGMLEILCMTGFRQRTFPGAGGRLRGMYPVDVDNAIFESRAGDGHIDYAVRYSHSMFATDIGIYSFYGTSREPDFIVNMQNDSEISIVPYYSTIHQTGIDIQKWYGNLLIKLESIYNKNTESDFYAVTSGIEYPAENIFYSGKDITFYAEYIYDQRGTVPPVLFEDDIFLGIRVDINDRNDTSVNSGIFLDKKTHTILTSIKYERRIFNQFRLNLEYLGFSGVEQRDLFYDIRNDSYFQVGFSHFF